VNLDRRGQIGLQRVSARPPMLAKQASRIGGWARKVSCAMGPNKQVKPGC
jgi:hypothetical protein